jgi:photosystem II stability/assembly factor-like uncharacterized protein
MIRNVVTLAIATALLVATPLSGRAATTGSVPARSVVDLEMFSPESGVAISQVPPATSGRVDYRYDLVRTTNGGVTWTITGAIPATLTPSALTASLILMLTMAFATPSKGYVALTGSRHVEFTDDGGRRWSVLEVPDPILEAPEPSSAVTIDDRSLWITTTRCRNKNDNTSFCPTDLVVYPLGHRTPQAIHTVPTIGPTLDAGFHSKTFSSILWSRQGNEGLFSVGSEVSQATLLQTLDAGKSWKVITDPCTDTWIAGLVQRDATSWVLYCNLDGGMHEGYNELWSTNDAGQEWAHVGQGSIEGPRPNIGSIGSGIADDLTVSGNGQVLWMLGSVGGIAVSADGGTDWQAIALQTGGYPGDIVTAGTTEAWLALPGTGLYRTLNGTTWARLS